MIWLVIAIVEVTEGDVTDSEVTVTSLTSIELEGEME